jgi:predicted  nucleic acid-binding Zn-ribbon protein
MNRYGIGIALVAAGGMVMTGALAADDAKELQAQLREAKATLSNYERGRYESPAVRAAKDALAKAQADDKAQTEAALKAKPEAVEVQKKIAEVETQRKEVDGKIREAYKAIEANTELVALKKKVEEAQAAWKAKYEELVKANAAIADMNKARDAAGTAINEANAKLVQIRLADNKEVADLKAKVAALEAKIAEMKTNKNAAKPAAQ